jgi:hypothetical protein
MVLLQTAFGVLHPSVREELISCEVDAGEFERLINLEQKAFDQDFTGGWRAVAARDGCGVAAGELIKAYIVYSKPKAPENLSILRWHAGQVFASAGHEEAALPLFRAAYEDVSKRKAWNLYVDATIAFIETDEEQLQETRDALAELRPSAEEQAARRKMMTDNPNINFPEGFVDQPQNLNVVEQLLSCIGLSYREAYQKAAPCES